jgi:hypothetical protein
MTLAAIRRANYALARFLGDVQAVRRGPGAVARRLARRAVRRQVFRAGRRVGL